MPEFPLISAIPLRPGVIEETVAALVSADVSDDAKAAFLRALRARGETPAEIADFARAMLNRSVDPGVDPERLPGPLIDVCGTGGDRLELFNVSTTAAFILAAGGAAVAKHGNRGVSSRSGGADVLGALGIRLDMPPADARECLETHGLCFFFAPLYHPAFAAIAPVRRRLAAAGASTIFNLLGPLLNPARPPRQLVGVFSRELTATFAEVFRELGRDCAWAVHGEVGDGSGRGMDEISTLERTHVGRYSGGIVSNAFITPEEAGLPRAASLKDLRGGDPAENARLIAGILSGEIGGPRRDLVLLNAAAAFNVAGLATGLAAGVDLAMRQIRDGQAKKKLQAMIDAS